MARRSGRAAVLLGLGTAFVAPCELPRQGALPELGQIALAQSAPQNLTPLEKFGPDPFFYTYIIVSILVVLVSLYLITKPYWEQRWLIERINSQKLKFITNESEVTPREQFELGRMYNALKDFPSALAEFEEVEDDFDEIRSVLDPEDAMGALAARAQLHNSKGFALMKLEPPRTAQARREFVRAVTYWPEYPEALLNIGRELIKRKRFDVAVRTLNTALKWQPGNDDIQQFAEQARMPGVVAHSSMRKLEQCQYERIDEKPLIAHRWRCIGASVAALALLIAVTCWAEAGTRKPSLRAATEVLFEKDEVIASNEVIDCQLSAEDRFSKALFLSSSMLKSQQKKLEEMMRKLPADPASLKVLLLEDAGFLKSSFWNKSSENFHQPTGLNYEKMRSRSGFRTNATLVQEWTRGFKGLDGGWSYDNTVVGLGEMFKREAFTHVSIFDLCANHDQTKALFQLQSQDVLPSTPMGPVDDANPCIEQFKAMLNEASVIFFNGGNPDMIGFALMEFAPQLGKMIAHRVRAGNLIYVGGSAGSMAASRDFAYTYEPNPLLAQVLLRGTSGLSLAGQCAIRPHYGNLVWNIPARVLAEAKRQTVVLLKNGDGLACDEGQCSMVGLTSREGPDIFDLPTEHLPRIFKAYQLAYKAYTPPRPNLVRVGRPSAPQCHANPRSLVMLASSGLEDDSKEAFREMMRMPGQPPKVLSLEDGAWLMRAFWDASSPDFARPEALNYGKAGIRTSVELVREATDGFAGLDAGWIRSDELRDLVGSDIMHVSAFDSCATQEQKKALLRLQAQGIAPQALNGSVPKGHECLQTLMRQLAEASVVVLNGGNPDLLGYVYKVFVPDLTRQIQRRVEEGSLVFLGTGAGAMVAGENFALTTVAKVPLLSRLLNGDMQGLGLSGRCAVRPGWNDTNRLWDISTSLLSNALDVDFVGLRDGDALACSKGSCEIRGRTRQRGATTLDGPDSAGSHRGRLDDVMAAAFH
ncbi:unnamed protein product [Effrenium voratum]|nr:unnamed protein product [Effrenium voratum]